MANQKPRLLKNQRGFFYALLLASVISPVYGDTYSLAPLVQDSDTAFYSSQSGAPSLHLFDGLAESGGTNLLGTEGGAFRVTEETVSIGNGVIRIAIKVTAVDVANNPEPWVDQSNAGQGYISWRLDVGSNAGGTDPIEPGMPFTLLNSGFTVLDKAGNIAGTYELTLDTSDLTGLSGVAALGNNDQDIAGVDLSTIQVFWEIATDASDTLFIDGFENAQ